MEINASLGVIARVARAATLSVPFMLGSGGVEAGKDKPKTPEVQQVQNVTAAKLSVKDYDCEASIEGFSPVFAFIDDVKNKKAKYFLPFSGVHLGPVKLFYQSTFSKNPDKAFITDVLTREGLKEKETLQKLKAFDHALTAFNSVAENSQQLIIELSLRDNGENLPLLQPKESPLLVVKKHSMAKYGFPIILNKKIIPDIGETNLDSIQYRYYVDPKDNKVKKGIYIGFSESSFGKNREGLNEEQKAVTILPAWSNPVIMPRDDFVIVLRNQLFFSNPKLQ